MIYSLKGEISYIGKDFLVIDVRDVGYQVFVPNVNKFHVGENLILFAYQVTREDEQYLAGFLSLAEREVFVSLISVKGIGPRTALGALKDADPEELVRAISSNNVTYLKKLPGIGAKAAAQIILDLKGQLVEGTKGNPEQYEEVRAYLKSLRYKNKEIDDVLAKINVIGASNEEIILLALKELGNK